MCRGQSPRTPERDEGYLDFWVFFDEDESLVLAENFKGTYHKPKLLKKLHNAAKIFSAVLPTKDLFPDLSLKKNLPLLQEILCS